MISSKEEKKGTFWFSAERQQKNRIAYFPPYSRPLLPCRRLSEWMVSRFGTRLALHEVGSKSLLDLPVLRWLDHEPVPFGRVEAAQACYLRNPLPGSTAPKHARVVLATEILLVQLSRSACLTWPEPHEETIERRCRG